VSANALGVVVAHDVRFDWGSKGANFREWGKAGRGSLACGEFLEELEQFLRGRTRFAVTDGAAIE